MVAIIPVDEIINAICSAGKNGKKFTISDLNLHGKVPITTVHHRLNTYIKNGVIKEKGMQDVKSAPGVKEKIFSLDMDRFEAIIGEIVKW